MSTKKVAFLAALALVFGAISIGSATPSEASATTSTSSASFPIDGFSWYVDCALDGAGEWVVFTGSMHVTQHLTIDGQGVHHFSWHYNPQGVVGVGQTSGNTYRGTGVTRQGEKLEADYLPYSRTYIDNFGVIGQGLEGKLHLKTTIRVKIDADGNTTHSFEKEEMTCK